MDTLFFHNYLLTIAGQTGQYISMRKEKLYYIKYLRKLSYHVRHLEKQNVGSALAYVQKFEKKQTKQARDGLFVSPRKMLGLACRDVRDVLQAMQRFEGVGVENWVPFRVFPEVNFR